MDTTYNEQPIKQFLVDVYFWLRQCYTGQSPLNDVERFPVYRVLPELQDSAFNAWREFEDSMPLESLIKKLENIKIKNITAYGLTAFQVKYKLECIEIAAQKAINKVLGWPKKVLDQIDNFLKSILKAIGVGDAMEELKDALYIGLPD